MTTLMELRSEYRDSFEKKHGHAPRLPEFLRKGEYPSAAGTLPAVNAEVYGDQIVYKNYYDIGVSPSARRKVWLFRFSAMRIR